MSTGTLRRHGPRPPHPEPGHISREAHNMEIATLREEHAREVEALQGKIAALEAKLAPPPEPPATASGKPKDDKDEEDDDKPTTPPPPPDPPKKTAPAPAAKK